MNRLTKIMFVWGFLLTSVWSHSSNLIYAQNQKFTFEFEQTTIKTIFQYIESHSEYLYSCIVRICWTLLKKYQWKLSNKRLSKFLIIS